MLAVHANVPTVLVAAVATALATGLGAAPFFFLRRLSRRWLGIANALAAGFMIGASIGLLYEGAGRGPARTAAGAAAGIVFLAAVRHLVPAGDVRFGALRGVDARKAVVIVGIMTLHSFTEGVGVGVSFGGGDALGLFIAIAIAVHNIPEGLAISLVLVPRGASAWSAAWWSVFSSLPQPLMAVPAFAFVETFRSLLPAGLGFAAGAMLWLVATELVPEAADEAPVGAVAGVAIAAIAAMLGLQAALGL
jgi:zinc transporter ZupT